MTRYRSVFLFAAITLLALSGCAGTRAAYRYAETPQEYAVVVAEHYAALVEEAATLKENGLDPQLVARLQMADQKAKPLILALPALAEAYGEVQSAENLAALQQAMDNAVMAVHEFINVLRAAQGLPLTSSVERREVYS